MLQLVMAVLFMALAAGGSVMQYHHHDPEGRICLCTHVSDHAQHPDNHDHNLPGHCEMRVSQPMTADIDQRHFGVPVSPILFLMPSIGPAAGPVDCAATSVCYDVMCGPPLPSVFPNDVRRRGPPSVG